MLTPVTTDQMTDYVSDAFLLGRKAKYQPRLLKSHDLLSEHYLMMVMVVGGVEQSLLKFCSLTRYF